VSNIVADYGIPMVLDATRLVENAVLIQRNEAGYKQVSIREIVKEFCRYFDHMTCSLAKDFGITRGGLVATNDAKIFSRARDTAATFGPGINATDKAMINAVFNDLSFVETMVNKRVDQASRLHAACVEAGLPLFMPSSGHCLLFDTADYLDLNKYKNAVTAFTSWVYQESGVRGGMHVTGMMREFANAAMVRFAIPLCMPDEKIDALTNDFIKALKTMKDIPDMEKTSNMGGIFGQMHAEYKPV
jgi:tryptophanase